MSVGLPRRADGELCSAGVVVTGNPIKGRRKDDDDDCKGRFLAVNHSLHDLFLFRYDHSKGHFASLHSRIDFIYCMTPS